MWRVGRRLKNAVVGASLTILLGAVGAGVGNALGVDNTIVIVVLAFVVATAVGVAGIMSQMRRPR